jgi:hypothetical protein
MVSIRDWPIDGKLAFVKFRTNILTVTAANSPFHAVQSFKIFTYNSRLSTTIEILNLSEKFHAVRIL